MLVRPTSWGRGKSSWGPWNGLGRGIVVSFRLGNKRNGFFIDFGDNDDSECVERTQLSYVVLNGTCFSIRDDVGARAS